MIRVNYFNNISLYRKNAKVIRNLSKPKQYYPKQKLVLVDKLDELKQILKEQNIKTYFDVVYKDK